MPTDQYYVCRVLCSKQCCVVSLLRRIEGRIYTTAREEAQGNAAVYPVALSTKYDKSSQGGNQS